ncbi:MAG: hypothetical protein HYY25_04825 [Candidatus Wallbacteria bacterium]|nr:hypothetical protein [Candidatus Wallbacteria bacterium]
MKTPLLLVEKGFHQVSSQFSLFKIQPRLLEASQRLEMLWRSRVPHPNPLDTKAYLNRYAFRRGRPLVVRDGRPALDVVEFLLASIDLTFVRHIVAPDYKMRNWQPIHDPPFLYAIHLWKTAEGLHHEEAIEILNHRRHGREARELLGLELEQVPKTYTVLTRFLERLGDDGFFKISRGFFWILAQIGIFVGDVHLAIDGQLLPSFSRYHGCNSFAPSCGRLTISDKQLSAAILEVLGKLEHTWPALAGAGISSQRHLVSVPCPFGATTGTGRHALDVRLGWLRVYPKHERGFGPDETSRFGIDLPWLRERGLGIRLEAPTFQEVTPGLYQMSCPRLPSDPTARIGWKNSNQPDGDPVPVFGVDVEQVTVRVPEYGLELPLGGLGSPGNSPTRLQELLELLDDTGRQVQPRSAALDARYDALDNYARLRRRHIAPIIALIHHKGEASPEAAAKRGVTMEGVPLAYCGVPMKPNGFDYQARRRTFTCGHQKPLPICALCPFGPKTNPNASPPV